MDNLEKVLDKLAAKLVQIKIAVGYRDVINGYGWHASYCFSAYRTIQYCEKCRQKYGYDYVVDIPINIDNHKHVWRDETKRIEHKSKHPNTLFYDQLVEELEELEKNLITQDSLIETPFCKIACINKKLIDKQTRKNRMLWKKAFGSVTPLYKF
jgi:hypothetical protein